MKTKLISTILLLLMSAAVVFGDVLRVGSSAPSSYRTITSALAAASAGDEIWVSKGVYREAELIIPSGVSVYGGFTGSESKLTERNFTSNATILDGSGAHRVAMVSGLLDGFTLRNGRTGDNGGGVLIKAGGTINHCIAFANEAGYDGGAVFAEEGATVENTLLTGNRAGNNGAAVSGRGAYSAVQLTAVDNHFTDAPEIKKALTAPASLVAGGQLNVAEPDITNPQEVDPHGSTILVKGWELDGHAIPMPYTVSYNDNGKKLRFWAANAVGVGVSNEVPLTVTWKVSSAVQLITPRAVCVGTTLAGAGITIPDFSPKPADGATYAWYIDGTPVSGLDYALQYTDNGRLLTCKVRNSDGSITGATTPAVRLAVMKAPEILFESKALLSIGDGEPLCLPTPVVLSNGSDLTAQGWKWTTDGGATSHDFNSCDKAASAMHGATVYYTAENACTAGTPVTKDYITALTVNKPVGEFLQTVTALCEGMPLGDCISFDDGDNPGDYYIGNTYLSVNGSTQGSFSTLWADAKATLLAAAHHANVLRFSYNAGRDERQMMLTVHAVPAITSNPVAPAGALCAGDAHTLAVEASGDNLTYQWERSVNSTDGADGDWNNVPGATTADCHFNADAAVYYRCTVKATCADKSPAASDGKLTSAAVKVIVGKMPEITTQPVSQTVCGETGIDLEVAATDAINYEWYHNGTATGTNAAKLTGVTDAGVYTCKVSNGCGSVMAIPAVVDKKAAAVIATQPVAATICKGESVMLGVKATGDGLTYQWYSGTTNVPATLIAGATSSTLTTAPVANTYYKCIVTGCTAVTSDVVMVTVGAATAITGITGAGTVKVCNTATMPVLEVTATGDGTLAYQWYKDGAAISGATDAAYTVKNTDLGVHSYEARVTGNCGSLSAPCAVVEVVKAPEVQLPTSGITACEGDVITLPVPAVETHGSVLDKAATGWCLATDEILVNSWKVTGPDATTWRYKVGYTCGATTGQKVFSGNLTVTPSAAPTITIHPKSETKCTPDAFTQLRVTVTGSAPLAYQWYRDDATAAGNAATCAPGTTAGVYHVVVSNACGKATSAPATLVRHAPLAATAYAGKPELCGSESTVAGVKVTAGAAQSYQWQKAGANIDGATSSTLAIAGEDGAAAVTRTYTCVVTDVCGKTVSPTVNVTHNPVPKITAQPVGGEVCNTTKELTVGTTGHKSFQWYKDGVVISGTNAAKYTVPNAVGSHSYYCMVTSEKCGSVASASVQVGIVQPPTFASTVALSTQYAGFSGEPVVLPAAPLYNDNGSTITGGRWVYGTGTALTSVFQQAYHKQELKYEVSYKGACNAAGGTILSVKQGSLIVPDFLSDAVPDDLVVGKFYYMMDARDRKVYKIKKFSNGETWMVQNLDYGTCILPFNDANSKGSVQGIMDHTGGMIYGVCKSSADVSGAPLDNGATWKYYNWQGVMNDADARYNMKANKGEWTNHWQGICPAGWSVPVSNAGYGSVMELVGSWTNFLSESENAQSWCGGEVGTLNSAGTKVTDESNSYWHADEWTAEESTASCGDQIRLRPVPGTVWKFTKWRGAALRCMKN